LREGNKKPPKEGDSRKVTIVISTGRLVPLAISGTIITLAIHEGFRYEF